MGCYEWLRHQRHLRSLRGAMRSDDFVDQEPVSRRSTPPTTCRRVCPKDDLHHHSDGLVQPYIGLGDALVWREDISRKALVTKGGYMSTVPVFSGVLLGQGVDVGAHKVLARALEESPLGSLVPNGGQT